MNDSLTKDYEAAKNFWNSAFSMDAEAKKEAERSAEPDGWKKMAPSEKLFDAVKTLGTKQHVLDYGCGRGWAAIIAAKSGCADVTAVESAENAAKSAKFFTRLYEVEDRVTVQHISTDWLTHTAADTFDGIVCSNVLDVVPEEVSDQIIRDLARIARSGASLIIGMNYYMVPKDNPERNMTVKHGNCVYVDNILRLVCKTDEEWSEIFRRYFTIEKLDHFAWPGEETERRRLFHLKKEG